MIRSEKDLRGIMDIGIMNKFIMALIVAVIVLIYLGTGASMPVSPEGNSSIVDNSTQSAGGSFCDATVSCPEGQDCYKFQDQPNPVCYVGNPCDRCPSKSCLIMESYPMQVSCQQ